MAETETVETEVTEATTEETTTETTETTPDPFKWEGLDEHEGLAEFVGDKNPLEVAQEAMKHRKALSQREGVALDKLFEEGLALKPMEKGSEAEFFGQFAPEDVADYASAAKEELGENAGAGGDAMMAAAKAAGLHPAQFKSMVGALKEANEAATQAQTEAFQTALNEAWGSDRAANTQMVERAAKEIAPDMDPDAVIATIAALNPGGDARATVRQLQVLADLGKRLDEGVADPGAGRAAAENLADEHQALIDDAVAAGGKQNLPPAKLRRLNEIDKEMAGNG